MPEDVIAPVPVYNLTVPRGASRTVRVFIETNGAQTDLSLPGTQVIFAAKKREQDAAPAILKAYVASGTTPSYPGAGGIVAHQVLVNNVQTWVADIQLHPADTDGIDDRSYLSYDIWLFAPDGSETPVAEGRLRLAPTTLRP